MKYSASILCFLLGLTTLIIALLIPSPQAVVQAQCKGASSCKTCHEVQKEKTVANNGPWHSNHSVYDFCSVCHHGDPTAPDKQQAHVGMVTQLKDMPANCKNCHEADLEQKFNTYAQILGVADHSNLKSAQSSAVNTQGVSSFFGKQELNPATGEDCAPTAPSQSGNLLFAGLLGASLLGSGGYVLVNEKRKHQPHA